MAPAFKMEAPTQLFKRTEQTKHGLIRDDDDDDEDDDDDDDNDDDDVKKDPMLHTLEMRLKTKTLKH
jgi:hypothetical protein